MAARPSTLVRTRTFIPQVPSLHRLDAYRLSLDFRRIVVRWLPLRRTELSDQLDRASISVPLNVAEGAGRITPRDRARHFTIARGSAVECLACLDLLELEQGAPPTAEARRLIFRVLQVLSGLMRRSAPYLGSLS
jgi:four helix bundle protein